MNKIEIAAFAEDYKQALSAKMLTEVQMASRELELGRWPEVVLRKGKAKDLSARIREACLAELHRFLCTNDTDYAILRRRANGLTQHSLVAISAFVAGTLGVSLAVVSAVIGFLALAVTKIGVNAFCRVVAAHQTKATASPAKRNARR